MSGIAASHLTTFLLWTFLPSLLSTLTLRIVYFLFPSTRPPALTPTSPPSLQAHHQKNHNKARIFLVTTYLLFTLLQIYYLQSTPQNQNFYTLLNLSRSSLEKASLEGNSSFLKTHWRKLAKVYHPDKVGKVGEGFFIRLKTGVDCLENEKLRWGYERFGLGVLEWGRRLRTEREFLIEGGKGVLAFYSVGGGSIFLLGLFRKEERSSSFWRYLILLTTLSTEFNLLLRANPSPLFTLLLPNRLPYEHIAFLRQLFISSSMAFSQIFPLLYFGTPLPPQKEEAEIEILRPLFTQLAHLVSATEMEVNNLQINDLFPLLPSLSPSSPSSPPPPSQTTTTSEEEKKLAEEKLIEEVKESMCRKMSELKIRTGGRKVWNEAVRKGWEEMGRENENGGGEGSVFSRRLESFSSRSTTSSSASSQQPLVSPPPTPLATTANIELIPRTSPPPHTTLSSPPPSPLNKDDKTLLSSPTSPILLNGDLGKIVSNGNEIEKGQVNRLPSPPPDD